ncbi:MAG: hypothetical protein GEU80_14090 [Dehalococcoidia bacterium]|nr:hypothetical protein [Dehalococcoidia bacterium]
MTRQYDEDERGRTPQQLRDERLSAFLDDELTADQRAAVEAELAADASMRAELEELRGVQQMLASLGEVRAPRPFTLAAAPARASMARRLGFARLEWAMRVGTGIAGIAFLVAVALPAGGASMLAGGGASEDAAGETMSTMAAPEAAGGGAELFRGADPDAPTSDDPAPGGPTVVAPSAGDDSGGGSDGSAGAAQAPPNTGAAEGADTGDASPGDAGLDRDPGLARDNGSLALPESGPPAAQVASDGPGGVELSLLVLTLLLAVLSSLPVLQRRRLGQGGHT